MPRLSEITQQRQSQRVPLRLKSNSSSEANALNRNGGLNRSSKPEDRRFPRNVVEEKKQGLRMADLEMKLDQTMEELKMLKDQLASAELAKTVVQKKLENVEKVAVFPQSVHAKDKLFSLEKESDSCITSDLDEKAPSCSEENAKQNIEETNRSGENQEHESNLLAESSPEFNENVMMRSKFVQMEMELSTVVAEKENFKKEVEEAKENAIIANKKTKEMEIKLAETEQELNQSKSLTEQLKLKLEAEEFANFSMQAEMKRLRIQTEQWRKASETAASILATEDESFRSMQKTQESYNFAANGILWSPLVTGTELDEGQERQKKRGSSSGIRAFGELWKKMGQQK